MATSPLLRISLFGLPVVAYAGRAVDHLGESKAEELLCYLLIHRHRHHLREAIAALLWPDESADRCRRNVRQTLWKLKAMVAAWSDNDLEILTTDGRTMRLTSNNRVWTDVAEFEKVWDQTQNTPAPGLDEKQVSVLERAVRLYRGDLLEGWYQDWCDSERARFHLMQLSMLDKLVLYHGRYRNDERVLHYGELALQLDGAHERTHQQLMRLHFARGDRTAALRQFERCVAALQDELGAQPSPETTDLYRRIRSDHEVRVGRSFDADLPPGASEPTMLGLLGELREDLRKLEALEEVVLHKVALIEQSLIAGHSPAVLGAGIGGGDGAIHGHLTGDAIEDGWGHEQ